MKTVTWYITSHGYGHGIRSADVLRTLREERPDIPVVIVSDLNRDVLVSRLGFQPSAFRPSGLDIGMVQKDSVRVDLDETERRLARWIEKVPSLVRRETEALRSEGAAVTVTDISGIPLEAAYQAGCPAFAMGNFGWDWIYAAHADRGTAWREASRIYADHYRRTATLFRLPFSEPMKAFPHAVDISLVARPGRRRRDELARATGADPDRMWVLLSFTSLDWDDEALRRLHRLQDKVEFMTVKPLAWHGRVFHSVDRDRFPYADVMASCDCVLTKPGYGVLSDAVMNDRPVVYTERTDFIEYDVLERELKRYLQHVHIPAEDLYAGRVEDALDAVGSAPHPSEKLGGGGDRDVVAAILAAYDSAPSRRPSRE